MTCGFECDASMEPYVGMHGMESTNVMVDKGVCHSLLNANPCVILRGTSARESN